MARIQTVFATFLVLSLILAGCMGSSTDDDSDMDNNPDTTTQPTNTADATNDQAQDDPTATPDEESSSGDPTASNDPTATEGADPEPTSEPGTATEPDGSDEPAEETEEPEPTATAEDPFDGFAYGWNIATRNDDQHEEHNRRTGEMVQQSGFGWVRFQIEWDSFERSPNQWDPLPIDRKIDELHSQGLNILVAIAKEPDWVVSDDPDEFLNDYDEFEEFTEFLANRYAGKVQAWEIWNEQNLALEFADTVQVEEYVHLLRAGSTGIRAGDPESKILFGGLTPTGVNDPEIGIDDVLYLDEIYSYNDGEIKDYFDIMGVHLNSTHNPPDDTWPDNITTDHEGWNDHPSFFFRRGEELYEVMQDHGDGDKPVWITEFGWSTKNEAPGRGYGENNTEEDVAQYLTRALEIAVDEWEWCTGAFVWNLNWSTLTEPEDHKHPSSALYQDWTPRPAYEALTEFPKDEE